MPPKHVCAVVSKKATVSDGGQAKQMARSAVEEQETKGSQDDGGGVGGRRA